MDPKNALAGFVAIGAFPLSGVVSYLGFRAGLYSYRLIPFVLVGALLVTLFGAFTVFSRLQ